MQEIATTPGLIVFIDELHTLVQLGVAEGSIDASNLFKPMLARSEFQCIGATTLDEYRKTIEMDPALERLFSTRARVRGYGTGYPKGFASPTFALRGFSSGKVCDEALQAAVKMSSRYIHRRFLPDKALDLIDEAASHVRMRCSVS